MPAGRLRSPPMPWRAPGLQLARTSPETQAALRACLHPEAQVAGRSTCLAAPTSMATGGRWKQCWPIRPMMACLAILVPQVLVDPVAVVEALAAGLSSTSVDGSGSAAQARCSPA